MNFVCANGEFDEEGIELRKQELISIMFVSLVS